MSSGLTKDDPHYWRPIPEVIDWLCTRLPSDAKVLEIGPGTVPFGRADIYVDFVDVVGVPPEKLIKCDIANAPLPFSDKSFDFVICRHMLEDMWNPFPICEEMSRVAKAGYIETPSPIAELCRGVDGDAPDYRGYHHHRYLVWNNDGTLTFVSKYPIIEYLRLEEEMLKSALTQPRYWNTYYLWSDAVRVKHQQSPLDFDIPTQYPELLRTALNQSVKATDQFCHQIANPSPFAELRSSYGA